MPKAQVLNEAIILAKSLAEKPRLSLMTLKKHLTIDIKAKLSGIIEKEMKMHDITFHQPRVAKRIKSLFGK